MQVVKSTIATRLGRGRDWVAPDVELTRVTRGPRAHFCGYHDLIPWSPAAGSSAPAEVTATP